MDQTYKSMTSTEDEGSKFLWNGVIHKPNSNLHKNIALYLIDNLHSKNMAQL